MKLSEAILKGCEMIPRQAFRSRYQLDEQGIAAACAQGAAIAAVLGHGGDWDVMFTALFPVATNSSSFFGLEETTCGMTGHSVCEWIACKNDSERRSREWIAEQLAEKGL